MKTCVLFCGQGSQVPGMGKELYARSESARRVFQCGSDILGFDLAKACFEGDAQTLSQTETAQPALFAAAMAGYTLLCEESGVSPVAVAGHSLGEYGALTAAGVFTLENGFRVLRARAAAMGRAAKAQGGAMYAVVGSDEDAVRRVCEETEGYVLPVNYNSPQQTVIAGEEAPAARAAEAFAAMGLKAVRLAVAGAFHTRLMESAAAEFAAEIEGIPSGAPKIPFCSNVTGGLTADFESFGGLTAYLCRHMVSPVLFTAQLAALSAAGCTAYAEAGAGKVLCGLVRRTLKGAKTVSLEDAKGLEKAVELMGAE